MNNKTLTRFPAFSQASYALKLKNHIIDSQAAIIERLTLENNQLCTEIRIVAREGTSIEYPAQSRHDQLEIEDAHRHTSSISLQQRILQLEAELDERNASITEMAELITTRETGQMALFQAVKDFITQEAGGLPHHHHHTDHSTTTPTKTSVYSSPGLEPDRILYWQQRLEEKAAESAKRLRGELSWAAETPGNRLKQQKSEEKEKDHHGGGKAVILPTSSRIGTENTALDADNVVAIESPPFDMVPMHQRGDLVDDDNKWRPE